MAKKTKICSNCRRVFSLDRFQKNRTKADGLQEACRKCVNQRSKEYRKKNRTRINESQRKYNHSERGWSARLKHAYGITLKKHKQIYLKQNGCCGICGKAVAYNKIDTDHDHELGKIRGLLCRTCNMGLGYFEDNLKGVMRAVRYLQGARNNAKR